MTAFDVAIVGMSCIFPGAPDLTTFWHNLESGVDAITDVPAERWDPVFYDPRSTAPDRFYCRRGGFVDEYATFDPLAFGIPPHIAEGAEPDQLLTLRVASEALADAGYESGIFEHERTGVVLGRGGYVGAAWRRVEQHALGSQQLVELLRSLIPELSEERLDAVRADYLRQGHGYGPDTAIGIVPNLAASRVANRLDLGGPAYTVDAACASSLIAVDLACRDLRDSVADLVIAGGVHLASEHVFWSVFSQLGAISRSEQIRPFDRRADGLLIGEGVGLVVLKRLKDAERDGDRVYAIIKGVGVSSDGRHATLLTPALSGQVRALERAYAAAGLDPSVVGLVEAHGTGTPAGDAAEIQTLREIYGAPNGSRAGLGTVKSMIGHAMPAAGAAGLIKAALAVHHGVLPPTLHCDEPHPALAETSFRPVREAEEWNGDRIAGVNAFGFGGINAHVILGSAEQPARRRSPARPHRGDERILALSAPTREGLLAALDGTGEPAPGPWRLAVADPTPERVAHVREAVVKGVERRGRDGIYFAENGLIGAGGKTVFLFPGVESVFEPRVDDIARMLDRSLPVGLEEGDLEKQGLLVVEVGRLLLDALGELGLHPDAYAGHSLGEWTGMIASGMIPRDEVDEFLETTAPGSFELSDVVYLALGCGADQTADVISDLEGVEVSHDNCPHQSIVAGPERQIQIAIERFRERRVLAQVIPFRSGFHSPAYAAHVEGTSKPLDFLTLLPASVPLWSATLCRPYPSDVGQIRELFARHLVEPVRFRELVLSLYEEGFRVFVQVGTGNLVGFIDDSLRGRPHHSIAVNVPQRSGLAQLRRAAAAMFVEGASVDLARGGIETSTGAVETSQMRLQLGVPLVRLEHPLEPGAIAIATPRPPTAPPSDPILAAFDAATAEILAGQEAVAQAFAMQGAPPATKEQSLVEQRVFSLERYPELVDHAFYPQPPGWPNVEDRGPSVPMTMSIEVSREVAREVSGLEAIAVEHARAIKWVYVEPPAERTLTAKFDGESSVSFANVGHFEAVVRVAKEFPAAPEPDPRPLTAERPSPVGSEAVYADGWMFHGPAYHGIASVDAIADDGIRGTIKALPAPGALLDAAGQLPGLWVAVVSDRDRMALPVRVSRIEFFGPLPRSGELLGCTARVRNMGPQLVVFDIEIVHEGKVLVRTEGWQEIRFETDDRLFNVIKQPAFHLLVREEPGYVILDGEFALVRTQEFMARRYLTTPERHEMDALSDARRGEWLAGRIAAKDAVRRELFAAGHPEVYPIEVAISNDPSGRPVATTRFPEDMRVSLAHVDGIAVATASVGRDVGIDVETVEPREGSFVDLAFSKDELALLPDGDRDEWLTRLWAAKEAAVKAMGSGFQGLPRDVAAERREGSRFLIAPHWVETTVENGRAIAWTVD